MKEIKNIKNLKQKSVTLCHGVFDIFHVGHLNYLKKAKGLGSKLLVSITADKYVNKGPNRPIFNHEQRLQLIKNLSFVDYVYINNEPDAISLIKKLKPKFYCKGKDYKNFDNDITRKIHKEVREVKKYNGKFVIVDEVSFSSSKLINENIGYLNLEQKKFIKKIKKKTDINQIKKILANLSKINFSIIGESIIDKYTFCLPENLSTKSSSISSRYMFSEEYLGGVLAIARNAKELDISFELITSMSTKTEKKLKRLLNKKLRVKNLNISKNDFVKERFISNERNQRLFELFKSNTHEFEKLSSKKLNKNIFKNKSIIVADYGHGLLNEFFYKKFSNYKNLYINVQTNSENYGYNLLKKIKKNKYFSIDEREARLNLNDRFSSVQNLIKKMIKKYPNNDFSITLGSKGSIFFENKDNKVYLCPAFFDKGLDATGAGDLYFLISSALQMLKVDPEVNIFISNIFAGLKTRIQGNSEVVKKIDLLKSLEHLLK